MMTKNGCRTIMKMALCLLCIALLSCKGKNEVEEYVWNPLKVTATAYNSVPSQTSKEHPLLMAWGDSLTPGMKCIAVSRDLIEKGLKHNTQVKIEGFTQIFVVKDKMNRRWRNRIDIYMDDDIEKAKNWGRKKLTIHVAVPKDSIDKSQVP